MCRGLSSGWGPSAAWSAGPNERELCWRPAGYWPLGSDVRAVANFDGGALCSLTTRADLAGGIRAQHAPGSLPLVPLAKEPRPSFGGG
jgi:hypothetical protein